MRLMWLIDDAPTVWHSAVADADWRDAGVWRPLMAALAAHGACDAELADSACGALNYAGFKADSGAAAAVREQGGGLVSSLAAVLIAHAHDANVVTSACFALNLLTQLKWFNAHDVCTEHVSIAVVAAMKRHPAVEDIQYHGCGVLATLCGMPEALVLRAAAAAVAEGAPDVVSAALSAHRSHSRLRFVGAHARAAMLDVLDAWPPGGGELWRATRAALVADIATDEDQRLATDVVLLVRAAHSLEREFAGAAVGEAPPGSAAVLCAALRAAAAVCAVTPGADVNSVTARTGRRCVNVAAFAFVHRASTPGAVGAAFAAEALAAGAVELLVAGAAACAALAVAAADGSLELPDAALCVYTLGYLALLAQRAPTAAEHRAAACGAHVLLVACTCVGAVPAVDNPGICDAAAAMAHRLRALERAHEDKDCDVPDCDLLAMRRRRCCLAGCGAKTADGGAPLKRCAGCRRAAYCCAAHQHAAWARHKALCRVRAAAEAACAALLRGGGNGV